MKFKTFAAIAILVLMACSTKDKYDVNRYYDVKEQYEVLTSIVTYIFDAPPYTKMEDRFKPEHRTYYSGISGRFALWKYFIAEDGTHYFYVIRPAPNAGEKRGVGGHFKMGKDYQLTGFREEFVTPILPENEVKDRCAFMFDAMVQGELPKYISMPSYVQWPNAVSQYDTVTYQWTLTESR